MKEKTAYVCAECGFDAAKWSGKCPNCGEWNTMQAFKQAPPGKCKTGQSGSSALWQVEPVLISDVTKQADDRTKIGIGETDRVLGGGMVAGSLVLLAGEPGIGKSTLLMQVCGLVCRQKTVLYVSGEESPVQLKMRADRLGIDSDKLYLLPEINTERILSAADRLQPALLIVDSIQTVFSPSAESMPGSVTQVKECTFTLMQYAKRTGITVFIVGHVNKDGAIAGPKVLEHMVDCVLYFEGDQHVSYRMLRVAKNRFGSVSEIGVFEMTGEGLREVPNPSEALLSGRPVGAPGSCVACAMEGSRPILTEIQALVTKSAFGTPRRMAAGIDYNRMVLILAILEKRSGLMLSDHDSYVNVAGGLRLSEPAADLPMALAIASSFLKRPVKEGLAAVGELGLTGELRSVQALARRASEVARVGFTRLLIPKHGGKGIQIPEGLSAIYADNLLDAIDEALV